MKKAIQKMRILILLSVLLAPLLTNGQDLARTERCDCNLDGTFSLDDLTTLINYLLTDSWNDYPSDLLRDTVTVSGIPIVMVKVEGGSYSIEEGVTATVGDFWICQTEVPQKLWLAVMGNNPSYEIAYLEPVERVSWDDCQSFISKLNELTGRAFRLPTSIEWEFAARGGNYSRGYVYAGSNSPDLVAHYKTFIHDIALLHPNELDLYDMSGNVCEWCQDVWNGESRYHIVRGGSASHGANECKVTWSDHYNMGKVYCGLRLAM